MNLVCRIGFLLLSLVAVSPLHAQSSSTDSAAESWFASTAEIPMRDGVKLHTLVISPKLPSHQMPFKMQRTPYGIPDIAGNPLPASIGNRLSKRGYILVYQDIRGRHHSEGSFVMIRPPHAPEDLHGIDECTDTYDTIEWLLHNVPGNNGRVGIQGVSYDGWLAAMALIHPHPALKAVSPQAPVADMFLGDDFHHNGAFRLSYGFEYVWMMESGKDQNVQWPIDVPDAYNWYLRLGSLANVNPNYLHGTRPSWNDFAAHPNYDSFWQKQAIAAYLKSPLTVPTLLVGGWYDQEDFYGPQRIYAELARHDPHGLAYLVLGPWNHGGWEQRPGQTLGLIDFGSAASSYYSDEIEGPWFDYWLKGSGTGRFPHVWTFETGSNRWVTADRWPPANSGKRNIYLEAGQHASFAPPKHSTSQPFDQYVSDPAHPAPYRQRPILPTYGPGSTWYTWLTDDQRNVEARPDILSWKTAPLTDDLTVSGDVVADLFASTSGTDSDWVVKLIDVYPEQYAADAKLSGYELIISDEVFRGRFRRSFTRPEAIPANSVQEYHIDLHNADHVFLKGHRIAIQIQSSWFPLIDRNPQRFVPNIFEAKPEDFQIATQRIYRSQRYPTHIELPVQVSDQTDRQ